MLQERSNITASFAEHLKFREQMPFVYTLWVNIDKSKFKKTRIRTLNISKMLYTRCSVNETILLLLSRNT